jgi:PAS domain S-box-containing protein
MAEKKPQTLSEYTEKFRELTSVFDNLPDGVIAIFDGELTVATANRQIADFVGLSSEKILGKKAMDVFERRVPYLAELMMEVRDTGKDIRNYTLEVVGPDGTLNHFLTSISAIDELPTPERGLVVVLHDITELTRLRESAFQRGRYGELFGKSEVMRRLFEEIESVSTSDAAVLIVGETGTGKELVARTIHQKGKRHSKPFVPVQCSALPEGLIESELFGHRKGAYTGASEHRKGRFELADGGTIFLDEIGTLSLQTQTKLLRVLQEKIIDPVGSSDGKRVDVRVVSATNRQLRELIASGEFREDLYYRLKVLQIEVPPLRERRGDIQLLANLFLERFSRHYQKNVLEITASAKALLKNYAWPGNVRELENAIEHGFSFTQGAVLDHSHLPAELRHSAPNGTPPPPGAPTDLRQEEQDIRQALQSVKGNRVKAATLLGLHRSTLWRKMREYGIDKRFGKTAE